MRKIFFYFFSYFCCLVCCLFLRNVFWFSESSNQFSFFSQQSQTFFFFFPDMESCQFLMSCSRIKELSDTSFSDTDSVIKSPWEELQGIVAEISEALCGSEDLARSDCSVFTQTP